MADEPTTSEWQRRVEDTWAGCPAVFDAQGRRLGHIRVERTVRTRPSGEPEIVVTNDLEFDGPLATKIHERELVLWISDTDGRRIYDGRDFQGGGTPYGRFLVGQDYIIPWGLETHVQVQVLPDGVTQLYSNLAHQGPRLVVTLGGLYATGVHDRAAFDAQQRAWSATDFRWPETGSWAGTVDIHRDSSMVTVPLTITCTAGQLVFHGGLHGEPITTAVLTEADGERYLGPDLIGNAARFGPMLFAARHLAGRGERVTAREVFLDGGARLAVAHQYFSGDQRIAVLDGVLERQG